MNHYFKDEDVLAEPYSQFDRPSLVVTFEKNEKFSNLFVWTYRCG